MAGKKGKCPKCSARLTVPGVPPAVKDKTQAVTAQAGLTEGSNATKVAVPENSATQANGVPFPQLPYEQRHAALMQKLEGDFPPVKRSPMYMAGIVMATLVMLLLPVLYIALIALTGYGVYYHAVNHVGMLGYGRGRAMIFVFLAYIAPIFAGSVLVAFMIKPLFARPANEVRTRSLTPQGEPLLFAFVKRLCELTGAPEPKKINVDYQMNASASFRRGFLSMFGSDLVLTIGVPMASGLTLQQLAGVLAHEFGHFSQGAGMRLTYIVRSINHWFARVVYQRDEWDEWLEETASELDIRIGWVLLLTQLAVFLSRCVLWVLMIIGDIFTSFMLRQMEFDADQYETRLSGSENFATTTHRIRELSVAYELTQEMAFGFLMRGKFPDNLSKMMHINFETIPPKLLRELHKEVENEPIGLFSTHPADKERIASSREEDLPGHCQLEGPASLLFRDFATLEKNVTWDLYCQLGAPVKPHEMDSVDRLLGEIEDRPLPEIDDTPLRF